MSGTFNVLSQASVPCVGALCPIGDRRHRHVRSVSARASTTLRVDVRDLAVIWSRGAIEELGGLLVRGVRIVATFPE